MRPMPLSLAAANGEVRSGRELPLKGEGRIDLLELFRTDGIDRLGSPSSKGPCHRIRRWSETHPGELDTKASPEELIERMGWKPKPRTGKCIGLMVKPLEEIWTWRDDFLPDVEASGLAVPGLTGKARRIGEIMDLGAGCTFLDMDGYHWIRIYISKTLRRYEQMPVPAAVH